MDFKNYKIVRHSLTLSFFILITNCNYSFDNYTPSPAKTFNLSMSDLIVETSSTAEVVDNVFTLKKTGTADLGCAYDSFATQNSSVIGISFIENDKLTLETDRFASFITSSYLIIVRGAKLQLTNSGDGTSGGLTPYVTLNIFNTTNNSPTGSSIATSDNISFSMINNDPTLTTFQFTNPVLIPANTTVALVIAAKTNGANFNSANYVAVASTDDTSGTACSSFPKYLHSTDSGSHWATPTNAPSTGNSDPINQRRGYALLVADVHASSGSGYWVVQSSQTETWNLSSLSASINSNGYGGTVTFDIGASDSTTPTFSETQKTLTEIQALSNLSGRNLFLRLNLSTSSPYYEKPEVTQVSINSVAK